MANTFPLDGVLAPVGRSVTTLELKPSVEQGNQRQKNLLAFSIHWKVLETTVTDIGPASTENKMVPGARIVGSRPLFIILKGDRAMIGGVSW